MRAPVARVALRPFDPDRNLPQLRVWLDRPHVSRWWGDPAKALAEIERLPPDAQALIAVGDRPVGYICWQRPSDEELTAAGLTDLPSDLMDIDLMIGEPDHLGQGVGPAALRLLLDRLRSEGHRTVGLAGAESNARALGAYRKAGFELYRRFREAGQDFHYLIQTLGPAG